MKIVLQKNNMFIIYRAALTILHVTWTLIIFFERIWADLRTRCDTVFNLFNLRKRISSPETELLVHSIRRINKNRLPRHLVLVLGRERPSFHDIVRIIAWCATAGIPCISFYDHDGKRPLYDRYNAIQSFRYIASEIQSSNT